MAGALEGITIIDFTQIQFGPSATQVLGDFGANVIKVERVGTGEMSRRTAIRWHGEPVQMLAHNRNKRCVAVDTSKESGKQIVYKLVERGDVVVNNFRPEVMERMGFGYEKLKEINPRIIVANGTGFGQDGPFAHKPGQDQIAQGMSGIMMRFSESSGKPVRMPSPLADYNGGQLLAQGILVALLARERLGVGQEVNVNLLDAAVAMMPQEAVYYLVSGQDIWGGSKRVPHPTTGIYKTKDGYITMTGHFHPRPVPGVTAALGMPELADDPRFAPDKVMENHAALRAIIEAKFLEKTSEEWLKILEEHDIVCGPIQTLEQSLNHPQVLHNNMIWETEYKPLGKIRVVGNPVKLSATPASIRMAPPLLGEHTDEVLAELGYDAAAIAELRAQKVVG